MRARKSVLPIAVALVSLLGCTQDAQSPVETSAENAVASGIPIVFHQLSAGLFGTSCGVDTAYVVWCWGRVIGNRPVRQGSGVRIRQVSTGSDHVCAIGADSLAYCFSLIDPIAPRHEWVAVPGGLRFRQIDASEFHTCAVTTGNRAFCWSAPGEGTLESPVPVKGGLQVRQIAAGFDFDCAVTTTSLAYCWGRDFHGQLGDDRVRLDHTSPRLVAGGHRFTKITAGLDHACAVTEDDAVFCWGGWEGVGDGGSVDRYVPSPVAGHHQFRRVNAGSSLTCGETPESQTFCWGNNVAGGLGNGTSLTDPINRPVQVVGGLRFAQVTTGGFYACGRTAAGAGYCWGYNSDGALGDGSNISRSTPTPIGVP